MYTSAGFPQGNALVAMNCTEKLVPCFSALLRAQDKGAGKEVNIARTLLCPALLIFSDTWVTRKPLSFFSGEKCRWPSYQDSVRYLGSSYFLSLRRSCGFRTSFKLSQVDLSSRTLPLTSSLRCLSQSANATEHKKSKKERWMRGDEGVRFHAGGATHELEVGQLKNGEWACQFVLCTTTWEGLQEGGSNTSRGSGYKVLSLEGASADLSTRHVSTLEKAKGKLSKKNSSEAPFSSSLESPTSSAVLQAGQKLYGPLPWTACSAKEQLIVRCTGSEVFSRALYSLLSNGTIVELDGQVILHREVLLSKAALSKLHTEIRLTQERLRASVDAFRVLYCGPLQSIEEIQEKIHQATLLP